MRLNRFLYSFHEGRSATSSMPKVPPGSSTVEVTLTPDGDATVLHLVHRDLPAGQGPRHMEGWEHFVPRLVEAATGRDPGPDPWSMSGAT